MAHVVPVEVSAGREHRGPADDLGKAFRRCPAEQGEDIRWGDGDLHSGFSFKELSMY